MVTIGEFRFVKINSTLKYVRTDYRSMVVKERFNGLARVFINRDIFLPFDRIIHVCIQISREGAFD